MELGAPSLRGRRKRGRLFHGYGAPRIGGVAHVDEVRIAGINSDRSINTDFLGGGLVLH